MLDAYKNKKIESKQRKVILHKKKYHFPHLSKTIEAVTYDEALKLANKANKI